ncbi:MAG: sigma-70 family RNA polymerase sigma factor [Candidatus Lokiarchaeota archaeon]|nr:sigma-70 family RNA polymerase sigma factor [Candidatus Lokiarchaeota archaeon]
MIEDLLKEYYKTRVIELRNKIIEYYMPFCKNISLKFLPFVSTEYKEDLLSNSYIGLINAVERYNPNKSKFEYYAYFRIRGAILDGIKYSGRHNQKYFKYKTLYNRYEKQFENVFNRIPDSKEELLNFIKKSDTFKKNLNDWTNFQICKTDIGDFKNEIGSKYCLEDDVINKILISKIENYISKMKEEYRVFIQLYYYEQLTLKDIAFIFNKTESRYSQIHRRVIRELQQAFKNKI